MQLCQTCVEFSNLFAAKTEELLRATSDMAGMAGVAPKREVFDAARIEVQRLRAECDTIKADMKRHQSEHGKADVSGETSECIAAIIAIIRSEFNVNAAPDRSAGKANVTFTVSGERYRVYLADNFEEQYAAAPQTGDLILATLPEKLRASSSGRRAVLVSRSGITVLPSSFSALPQNHLD